MAKVTVNTVDENSIQIRITGEKQAPTAEVVPGRDDLVLSIIPQKAAAQTEADEEIEVIATGEGEDNYFVPDANTATRTDTPIRDIPASIQVVPREVIRDQGATSTREAVRNVSGVTFSSAVGNRSEQFIMRGFTANRFLNGFREDFLSTRTQTDLANIERIEVLKGPASVLFGRAEPSGIINFITKQPLREPFYELSFTAGSFDFYRPALDFSGPLTDDKRLAYRLNVAYENAGSFRDFVDTERFFIAPTLSYRIGDNTTLSLEVSHLDDARPIDRGLVVLSNNQIADIPISRLLGKASDQQFAETRAVLYFDHRFNPNLSLRSAFRYTEASEKRPDGSLQISEESPDDRNFPVRDYFGTQLYEIYTFQNDLIANFNTGSVEHTVLLGLELARQSGSFSGKDRSAGTIDIFNPNYNFTFGEFENFSTEKTRINSFGIYLQDQIALLDNLILVLGGRFDTFRDESTSDGETTETEADAFSPRVGIVYQPIEPVSLYASYTRSFTPAFGTSASGEPFDPQRGTGYEIGVKTEIVKNRLFSTLAFYDTTLTNVLTTDPENDLFEIQTGEQNSKGIELDLSGEILPGWNIFAGYAYSDATITEDNTFEVGNRLNNVPRHNFNLWTTYTLQKSSLAGLGFGAGIFYVSERAGDLDNSFFVPDYTRVDAAIYYERENFRAALNLKNLFDIRYFEGAQYRESVIPGAPFTVLGTISVQF
ncbi:TonB-dependent siderophore receptor [Pleurocapsales cyanobacterium LEGE 06147]|nr:TonB-dependent siderophore receptor [Pleurocapsales cyanobacterium LEGE 06147]